MNRKHGRTGVVGSFTVVLLALAMAAAGQEVSLDSSLLRMRLNAGSGLIGSLVDRKTGREWLDSKSGTPLYRIKLVGQQSWIASYSAASTECRQEAGSVTLISQHADPVALTVTCRFRLDAAGGQILGRIGLRFAEPQQIEEVRFPVIKLPLPFSGTGEQDRVLSPYCDGTLLSDPSRNSGSRRYNYPGAASLQMTAAFDPAAGLYLASHDSQGYTKTFCSGSSKKLLELGIGHLPARTAAQEWELPYEVSLCGLKPTEGLDQITWESGADVYRQWAVQQPWCRQTMAQRVASGDIPKWIVDPQLIFTFSLRGKMPDGSIGQRLPLVVEQTRKWSKLVEAPVTTLIMSWEKLDSWTTPDYFPPCGGAEMFADVTRTLHGDRHRAMVFLSGLHWTLHKDMAGPGRPHVLVDQQAEFDRRGRASAISDAQGRALVSGDPTKGVGQHATICASTPLAREILFGSSMQCQKLGIDCVQVDQIVGGGMKPCYHPNHPHPPGGGNWCSQALYRLFEEIRREGKANDPDFAFAIEEPGEFYLPVLDTYHARDLHQGRWPRSGSGVLGVPLFTHVYHDFLAGYGSEGCYVSSRASQLAMYQLGTNLVCGKVPAVAIWGNWCDPETLDPKQARLLKAHLELWRGPAGEFLNFGQRLATVDLDVPTFPMTFRAKNGKKSELALPSVLRSSWRLPDGRVGTILVCISAEKVEFTFGDERMALAPGEAAFRPRR
jgi:hypothetical protein